VIYLRGLEEHFIFRDLIFRFLLYDVSTNHEKLLEYSSCRLLNANFDFPVPAGHSSSKRAGFSSSVRLKTIQWKNR
jgi:hypothetical protein